MGLLWFAIISVMLAIYVVLDGFDLGAGALHLILGRTDEERRKILRSIGPVWDGNEVWLLATGGVLYFVFPQLYASSFSGFYLPLMIVLWLLMMRAIGVEFREHIADGLWAALFDAVFSLGSLLLCVFYGAALGNVVRGVPLGPDHYFFLPLWTDWRLGSHPGVLDWYTVLTGVIALIALMVHGANWIALKTDGALNARARRTVLWLTPLLALLTLASLGITLQIHPNLMGNYQKLPLGYLAPLLVLVSLIAIFVFQRQKQELAAFLSGALYLVFMLVGAVFALFPVILPSVDPQYQLTVANSITSDYALRIGLRWWCVGVVLVACWFGLNYWLFRGKVAADEGGHY